MSNQIKFIEVPAVDGVSLRLVDLRQSKGWPLQHLLADWERERAARFRFEHDARRYLVSHVALRVCLGEALHCIPDAVRLNSGSQGKPYIEGHPLHFNMSHSGDWALIGWHPQHIIGVDIESGQHLNDTEILARHNFATDEKHDVIVARPDNRTHVFLNCWTRKEACLKALGSGFTIEPHVFSAGTEHASRELVVPVDGTRCARMRVQSIALPTAPFELENQATPYAALAVLAPESHHLAI